MSESIQGPVAVLTGAGISAESGVPTFRGEGGLWCNFRPPGCCPAGGRTAARA